MKKISIIISGVTAALAAPTLALAEWVPLISSDDFAGLTADVLTAVAGIISIVLIIVGIGMLVRMLMR